MLSWHPPYIFKKTQASKLGDAQGIPSSSSTTIRSSPLELSFYQFAYYMLFLERQFVFVFLLDRYNVGSQLSCVAERHARLFHQNTPAYHVYLLNILSCCLFASKLFHLYLVRSWQFILQKALSSFIYICLESCLKLFGAWLMCQDNRMSCMWQWYDEKLAQSCRSWLR